MTGGETAYLVLVTSATVVFMVMLAWVSWWSER
jgi:hypothetical protein